MLAEYRDNKAESSCTDLSLFPNNKNNNENENILSAKIWKYVFNNYPSAELIPKIVSCDNSDYFRSTWSDLLT